MAKPLDDILYTVKLTNAQRRLVMNVLEAAIEEKQIRNDDAVLAEALLNELEHLTNPSAWYKRTNY